MIDACLVSDAMANFKSLLRDGELSSYQGKFLFGIWLFCTTTQSLESHPFRASEQFVPNMILETRAKAALDCFGDLDIISLIWPLILLGLRASAASKLWKSYFHHTSFTYQYLFLQCQLLWSIIPPLLLSSDDAGLCAHWLFLSFLPFLPFPRSFWNTLSLNTNFSAFSYLYKPTPLFSCLN